MAYENWLNPRQAKLTQNTYKLDVNKTPEQNIVDIILGLYIRKHDHNEILLPRNASKDLRTGFRGLQRNVPDGRRLAYFNALVNLLYKENKNNWGFTTDELMTCVRISLVDDSPVVRVAALRVLRYLIKTESDVGVFNTLKLPYLVVRAMDMVRNEEERAQALRVVRRVISVLGASQQRRQRAAYVDIGLLRCLVAAARAGGVGDGTGDRLARPAVATLAEIGVLNAELFISCGGVNAVSRQLMECATPRMAEALCGVLLHLLNDPTTRRLARVDLSCLCASYCDFHIRPSGVDTNRDEREMRFTCSRLALVCVLRSWPGVLHFCHPANSGGLRALVAALRLPRLHVRKAIMDLLYELVGLPQPEWTDEISVALSAVDPSDFQDAWRLNEGFVAAEGAAILPHLSTTGPDIVEIHLALLLQCFLEAGLLDSLAEVIVTSDTFISVRATVLLGQLLHLIHLFLPPQICSVTPTLPALMSGASAGRPQALAAVQALRTHHALLDARPATTSLFLDHIIQYCTGAFREKEDTTKSRKEKDNANMAKPKDIKNSIEFLNDSDENEPKQRHSVGSRADVPTRNVSALVKSKSVSSRTSAAVSKVTKTKLFGLFDRESDNLIRCTLVMQNKDGNTWNWEIIRTILKESDSAPLLNLNDSSHKAWVSRIVNYLKPSSNKFSHQDLSTSQGLAATRAGCQLIRHLLRHNDADSQRLLEDLFYDVSRQIEAIETGVKAHECLFSPQHMSTTNCQMYFLFIGQLCHTQTGLSLFKQTRLHENLIELSTKTHHTCYVKLIITSLNYTLDSHPREILAKTLTCSNQASKLYATQFLHVLLRASRKSKDLVRRKSKLKKNIEQLRAQKEEAESNGVDMETWILQLLVSQIKDDYKAVVKSALSILEEAYSVPAFVDKLVNMRDALCQSCHLDKNADPATLDFSAVGDRGYLIWLGLEVAALAQTSDAKAVAFVKKHLDFWTRSYNYRYARLVDSGVHEALTLSCRSRVRRAARPPPHLQAALAARRPALLADTLPALARTLQRKKCATEQDIMDLKASLWAIGNIAMTSQGFQLLMNLTNGYEEDSVAAHIVKLATYCPVYSVRATAFYVLGLIATTYEGANLLSELGWLCVRHTRHEQFPVIPDETYLFDSNVPNYITSPDKKLNAFDVELSEHSDHTDQSMIDSTHIEIKHTKTGSTSDELKEMDVVDYKTNESRSDKRKSHTLPSQSCSTSHERPTLSESRTVDIIRDCTYERPIAYPRAENRLLIGRMNSLEHAHEGRVRNTSESSTSGVSSCDSFLGKYAIPDRVLTLSPIPSSSSLQGMKGSSSAQRPKISDLQRRTSTSSFTTSEIASSPPGHLDMTGYATLKSLNKHRRPHLSESAASASDMEDISWLLTDTNRRSKPFSSLRDRAKSTRERMAKLSLLDYDWKPLSLGEARQSPPPPARAPRRPPPPPAPHPAGYIGIALPSNLAELFPREEVKKIPEDCMKYVSDAPRRRLPSSMVDSSTASDKRASPDSQKLTAYKYSDVRRSAATYVANNIGASTSALISRTTGAVIAANRDAFASSGSSVSTVTQTPGNFKALSRVTEGAELTKVTTGEDSGAVSDATVNNVDIKKPEVKLESDKTQKTNGTDAAAGGDYKIEVTGNVSTASDAGTSSSRTSGMRANVSNVSETGTASSITVGKTAKSEPASEGNSQHKPEQWKHATADCLACVPTRPPSSHELREAFLSGVDPRTSTSPVPERSPQAELLHHVYFMSNPIHLRQTRSALLSLKQSHPEIFRSPCVYSDVCALLSGDTYMLCARRFVQELFCETCFECFIPEPREILLRHGVVPTSRTPSPEQQNEAGKREPGGPKGPIGPQPGPSGSQNEQTGPQRGRAGSQNDKTGQQRGRAGSQNDPTGTLRKSIAETQETKAELQAEPRAKVEPKTNNQSEQDKSQAVPQTKRQSGSSRDSKVEPHFDIQSLPKPGPVDE